MRTHPAIAPRAGALVGVALLCLSPTQPAQARPFTVDDLLREEAFGTVGFDPTGRWLAVEQRVPYQDIPNADYEVSMALAGSRLAVFDVTETRPSRRWVAGGEVGVVAGDFAPDGRRLAVFRLQAHRWEVGIATTQTGTVRWLGLLPQDFGDPRAVQWRSNTRVLAIARSPTEVPHSIGMYWRAAELTEGRWDQARRGAAATTVYGSGAYRTLRARPAPRDLVQIDVSSGARTVLLEGEITDFELSPDGRHVAVLVAGPDLQPTTPGPVQGPLGLANQAHELRLIDLETGRVTQAATGLDVMEALLAWSPGGTELLAFARRPGAYWSEGELLRVATDGTTTPVPLGPLTLALQERPEIVRAAWLGDEPLVLARSPGSPTPEWYRLSPHGPVPLTPAASAATLLSATGDGVMVLAGGSLIRVDRRGRIAARGEGLAPPVPPRIRRAGRAARQPPAGDVAVMDAAGGALQFWPTQAEQAAAEVALPQGAVIAALSAAGRVALVRQRDAQDRESLWLLRPGAAPERLAHINQHLGEVDAPRIAALRHRGPRGQPLTSWLFLPPGPQAAPPALVVRPYLGSRFAAPPLDEVGMPLPIPSARMLVGAGYAVLVPSLPKPNPNEPLEGLAETLLAIVDVAAQDPALAGAFDPQRLFIWGQSYGGYTTLAVTTQTDRFLAAVANGAPSQLFSMHGVFQPSWRADPQIGIGPTWPMGWVETAQGGMRAPPWEDPDRYVRNSPALLSDRIRTPILLLHGDLDTIPLQQAEQMFSALYRQNKDAVLVTYWGEAHFLTRPATVRDVYRRVIDWFATHDPKFRARAEPPAANPARASASTGSRPRSPPPAGSR